MDRTLISINGPNIASIVIMGAIGYGALFLLSQAFQRWVMPSMTGSY